LLKIDYFSENEKSLLIFNEDLRISEELKECIVIASTGSEQIGKTTFLKVIFRDKDLKTGDVSV
jgi:hypothetical protein